MIVHCDLSSQTKKNPHRLCANEGFDFNQVSFSLQNQIKSLAVTYFHIDKVDTSIGAERFHFRVRKGIGWFPLAMAARQTGRNGGWSCPAPAANSRNLLLMLGRIQVIDRALQNDSTLGKSLGCYMVKPHGQLVLVS